MAVQFQPSKISHLSYTVSQNSKRFDQGYHSGQVYPLRAFNSQSYRILRLPVAQGLAIGTFRGRKRQRRVPGSKASDSRVQKCLVCSSASLPGSGWQTLTLSFARSQEWSKKHRVVEGKQKIVKKKNTRDPFKSSVAQLVIKRVVSLLSRRMTRNCAAFFNLPR